MHNSGYVERVCSKCKVPKPLGHFSIQKSTGYFNSWCKACSAVAAKKRRYGQQALPVNTSKQRYERRRRKARQIWLLEYLRQHPCVDCGETDPVVLDFDHVKGRKDFHISRALSLGWAIETIEKEMEKCVVRCSNCHRRVTARRQNWTRYRLSQGG